MFFNAFNIYRIWRKKISNKIRKTYKTLSLSIPSNKSLPKVVILLRLRVLFMGEKIGKKSEVSFNTFLNFENAMNEEKNFLTIAHIISISFKPRSASSSIQEISLLSIWLRMRKKFFIFLVQIFYFDLLSNEVLVEKILRLIDFEFLGR
jgi:hypothetical protein